MPRDHSSEPAGEPRPRPLRNLVALLIDLRERRRRRAAAGESVPGAPPVPEKKASLETRRRRLGRYYRDQLRPDAPTGEQDIDREES